MVLSQLDSDQDYPRALSTFPRRPQAGKPELPPVSLSGPYTPTQPRGYLALWHFLSGHGSPLCAPACGQEEAGSGAALHGHEASLWFRVRSEAQKEKSLVWGHEAC